MIIILRLNPESIRVKVFQIIKKKKLRSQSYLLLFFVLYGRNSFIYALENLQLFNYTKTKHFFGFTVFKSFVRLGHHAEKTVRQE